MIPNDNIADTSIRALALIKETSCRIWELKQRPTNEQCSVREGCGYTQACKGTSQIWFQN